MRAQLEKRLAQKEKERKEENLRELAKKAREERAGIRTATAKEGETLRWEGIGLRSRRGHSVVVSLRPGPPDVAC